jgi:MFS family permease
MLTRRQRWVLALTSLSSLMVALDALVVTTALPTIRHDLHASVAQLEWTVNAYTLSFAVLLMTAAVLGDRLGRRRLFAGGLVLFTAASAACALAPSIGLLIAARTIQGAGAAAVAPLSLSLLSAAFPPERRAWALGIFSAVTGIAVLGGPVLGGAIAQGLAWEWIFWLNVPIGLAVVAPTRRRMPESFGPRVGGPPRSSRRSRPARSCSSPSPPGSCARRRRCSRRGCSARARSRPPTPPAC